MLDCGDCVGEVGHLSGRGGDLESAEVVTVDVRGAVNGIRNPSWMLKEGERY